MVIFLGTSGSHKFHKGSRVRMLNLGLRRLHEGVREQSTIRMGGFGDRTRPVGKAARTDSRSLVPTFWTCNQTIWVQA